MYEAYYLRGLAKYNLGDLTGAEYDFSRAITCVPEFPRLYMVRGVVRSENFKFQRAMMDFETAIELDSLYTEAYFYRAFNYLNLNEYTLALDDVNKVIDLDSTFFNIYLLRGAIYAQLENYPEAIFDFNRCLEENPENGRALVERGTAYAQLEITELAMADFDSAIVIDSANGYAYFQRGLVKMRTMDYEGAMEDLNIVLELSPENELALFNRALIKSSTQAEGEAIDDFIHILNQNPDNMLVYYNMGISLARTGHFEDAIRSFSSAIELYPDYADAYYQRALVKKEMGDKEDAYRDMRQFEKLNAKNLEKDDSTKYEEGLELLRLTRLSNEFIKEEEKKQKVQYNDVDIVLQSIFQPVLDDAFIGNNQKDYLPSAIDYNVKSLSLYSEKKHKDSLAIEDQIHILDSLIQTNEHSKWYYLKRGMLYTSVNEPSMAIEDFNKALSYSPNNLYIHFNRAIANITLLYKMTDQENMVSILPKTQNIEELRVFSDIIYDLQKVLDIDPNYLYARYNMGYARFLMANYADALIDFSIVAARRKIAEAHFNKGLLQVFLNDKDKGCIELGIAGELGLTDAYSVMRKLCK